ncbi:hypothetical protein DVV97_16835 [Clostridium botulinum]|nr:hypothetical protein [Clostridium botulinum]
MIKCNYIEGVVGLQYRELKIFIILKKDISLQDCGYTIGKFISSAMSKNKELLDMHNCNMYKNYTYDNLYPIATNSLYLSNSIYTFRIHSIDNNLMNKLREELSGFENNIAKVMGIEDIVYKQKPIDGIFTVTPVIVTLPKDEYGKINFSDCFGIQDIIIKQLVRKYSKFTGQYIKEEDAKAMFTCFNVASSPISLNYKGIKLTGIKIEAIVAPDKLSQSLAFFGLACGLGEKTSTLGTGFTIRSSRRGES